MQLEKLKDLTALTEKISVYVPSTFEVDSNIDNAIYVEKIMREMASIFGGSTSSYASGAWISDSGKMVLENINIVYSYTDAINNDNIDKVLNLCYMLKNELKQECISLEISGKLYFI